MTKNDIQDKILEVIKYKHRCSINVSVGAGKTLAGIKRINQLYESGLRNFLIVAPKLKIFDTWRNECKKHNYEFLLSCITFVTYVSFNKIILNHDLIIFDEVHNILPSHQENLDKFNGKILGMTGTMPSKFSVKGRVIEKYCPVSYTYLIDDAINDEIINDYKIIVHELVLNTKNTVQTKNFITSELKNYEYINKLVLQAEETGNKNLDFFKMQRMRAITSYETKVNYTKDLLKMIDDKCIIFCNTKKQAEYLCEHNVHSTNKNSKNNLSMFINGEINKLSCVDQLDEGVNIPNLKSGIILHSYSSSSPKSKQRIGRFVRLNPKNTSTIHILMYKNTIDEMWVKWALSSLDQSKIFYFNPYV